MGMLDEKLEKFGGGCFLDESNGGITSKTACKIALSSY
jgi:hypothetical protein